MYRDGKWIEFQTTVQWLEVDGEGLAQHDATFSSVDERQAFMKEKIESGMVYDVLSFTESNYGGEPRLPWTDKQERELRGGL